MSKEEFVAKANKIYDNMYDYTKVIYVNSKTKVIIVCKMHGDYSRTPTEHLSHSSHCPQCMLLQRRLSGRQYTGEDFIKKARMIHGHIFDYSEMNFVTCDTKIKIKCEKGHVFYQLPFLHVRSVGCPTCNGNFVDTKIFIEKANKVHNEKYDYSKVDYVNGNVPVEIICAEHGSFFQAPRSHVNNAAGCTKCNKNYSRVQIEWLTLLMNMLGIKIDHAENIGEHRIKNSRYKADGYCEKTNTIFEFNGCYYHGCDACFKNRDDINKVSGKSYRELFEKTKLKEEHCVIEGYQYIAMWECQWTQLKKSDEQMNEYMDMIRTKLNIDDDINDDINNDINDDINYDSDDQIIV
jgi:hypothetical protein